MATTSAQLPITVAGKASLVRPQFSPGLLLQDDDLTLAVDYTRNLQRLLFKTLLGCGVLCGFKVTASIACGKLQIAVEKGVALDCRGDVVELPDNQTLAFDPTCGTAIPPAVWVSICRREQACAPRDALCSPADGEVQPAYTRLREGYEIRATDGAPAGYCGCGPRDTREDDCRVCIARPDDPCYQDHYQGKCPCDCGCGDCLVLAKVTYSNDDGVPRLAVDHSVRRFIRPVLMCDPLVERRAPTAPGDTSNPPSRPGAAAPARSAAEAATAAPAKKT